MANDSKATETTETPKKVKKPKMYRTPEELDLYLRFAAYRMDAQEFQAKKRARYGEREGEKNNG